MEVPGVHRVRPGRCDGNPDRPQVQPQHLPFFYSLSWAASRPFDCRASTASPVRYASTLAEAAAYAVSGGLDLEDANSPAQTVFGGIAAAIKQGLLPAAAVDESVGRLMYVRMRTGEFDDPAGNPVRAPRSMDYIPTRWP